VWAWRQGQKISRPCGQWRTLASRRDSQGSKVLPRMRQEWTGRGEVQGDPGVAGEPGADIGVLVRGVVVAGVNISEDQGDVSPAVSSSALACNVSI